MHIILSMTRRYKMLQHIFNFFRVSAENADRIQVNCSAGQTPVTSFKINAFNNLTKDKKTGSGRPTNKRADKQQRLSNKPTRQGSKGFTFRCLFSSGYIDKKLDVLVSFKANVNQRYVYSYICITYSCWHSVSQLICGELLQFILFGWKYIATDLLLYEIAEGKLIGVFLYIKFWAILKNVYSSLSSFF